MRKILYFDDEPFISKALANHLELFDWDVTLVSEIDELFEKLSNNDYSLLILDVMAPIPDMKNTHVSFSADEIKEMDGGLNTCVVLAKKIWATYKDLPILFLSARRISTISQLSPLYKYEYIRKPELAKTINDKLLQLLSSNNDVK